jgi:uroporphyrin-III C-methyltransferase
MKVGRVILAGAGPGDPELITLKTLKYIQSADVILTDRLVSPILIEEYAHPKTNVIYVGKQCSKGIHTPQSEINKLMVDYANQGLLVLRLKGGDASLFSNILDELQVLKENKIPYEVIPGITAAFGASAYTGIPLTARGYSRGVRLLTLYDLEIISSDNWKDWCTTEDTLVFYMSGQKVKDLAKKFSSLKVDASKKMAIIEQATTSEQSTTVFDFSELSEIEKFDFQFVPTLIIIGKVVSLHKEFAWKTENNEVQDSYFDNHKINMAHAV